MTLTQPMPDCNTGRARCLTQAFRYRAEAPCLKGKPCLSHILGRTHVSCHLIALILLAPNREHIVFSVARFESWKPGWIKKLRRRRRNLPRGPSSTSLRRSSKIPSDVREGFAVLATLALFFLYNPTPWPVRNGVPPSSSAVASEGPISSTTSAMVPSEPSITFFFDGLSVSGEKIGQRADDGPRHDPLDDAGPAQRAPSPPRNRPTHFSVRSYPMSGEDRRRRTHAPATIRHSSEGGGPPCSQTRKQPAPMTSAVPREDLRAPSWSSASSVLKFFRSPSGIFRTVLPHVR